MFIFLPGKNKKKKARVRVASPNWSEEGLYDHFFLLAFTKISIVQIINLLSIYFFI
jgi:hypothetical protein